MFHLTENQYLERYKMPDIESALLDGKLNEIFEQNNYDLDIITNIPKFANSKDFINWKQHFIYEIVSDFTSRNVFADTKKKRLDMLVRHGVIESYEIDGHTLMLKLEGDEKPMFFSTLTDEFPKLALMDIELTSKNARAGHCRTKSLHTVSPALLDPHEIVSGTIGGINRNAKYLHTWVETELGGIKCVIDTTMNAIVDANSYYKLVNANPQCRISNKDLQADAETITPLLSNGELYIEQYLYNHDDIMNYLQQTKN